MGEIVIKKKVSLDFLGEEYAGAYITFKAVPFAENDTIASEAQKAIEDKTAVDYIKNTLFSRFIEGKFPDTDGKLQDLTEQDLNQFPNEVITECFERVVTGKLDPKV